ncbi:MAG: group III truncated hemoglobin [Saprospiraceae bacterium]
MKRDIQDRADIDVMVKTFYGKLLADEQMAPLFAKVVGEHLADHFHILCDFWESVLFFTGQYKGNTMEKHLALHDEHPLSKMHFDTWLAYFKETVDTLFEGEKATLAKERATSIAFIMQMKINQL